MQWPTGERWTRIVADGGAHVGVGVRWLREQTGERNAERITQGKADGSESITSAIQLVVARSDQCPQDIRPLGRYADVNGCAVWQLLSGARQRNVFGQAVEYPAHHLEPPRVTRNAKLLE